MSRIVVFDDNTSNYIIFLECWTLSGAHIPWTNSPAVITTSLLVLTPGFISLEQKRLTHLLQIGFFTGN